MYICGMEYIIQKSEAFAAISHQYEELAISLEPVGGQNYFPLLNAGDFTVSALRAFDEEVNRGERGNDIPYRSVVVLRAIHIYTQCLNAIDPANKQHVYCFLGPLDIHCFNRPIHLSGDNGGVTQECLSEMKEYIALLQRVSEAAADCLQKEHEAKIVIQNTNLEKAIKNRLLA